MRSTSAREVTVGRPAVFLDRDGVLNDPVRRTEGPPESPLDPRDVRLVSGAAEALARLRRAGYALVVVSNQPAVAKRQCAPSALQAVHQRVVDLLATDGVILDAWYYCYHHPQSTDPELGGRCTCRKPAPGLLLAAAEELELDLLNSWMVGDSDADLGAGRTAGCRTVLVEHPQTGHRRGAELPDVRVPDLRAAGDVISGQKRPRSELAVDA